MEIHQLPSRATEQLRNEHFLHRWAAAFTLVSTIPDDNRFNMNNWAVKERNSECGTAACLAGHAILHSWFIERGFRIQDAALTSDGNPGIQLFNVSDNAKNFWGLDQLMQSPFDPDFCIAVLGLEDVPDPNDDLDDAFCDARLAPQDVAEVVYSWLVAAWGQTAADKAIAQSTVVYDANEVHKNAPWSPDYVPPPVLS